MAKISVVLLADVETHGEVNDSIEPQQGDER